MDTDRRKISTNKLKKVAEIFGGLAHPSRLEILEFMEDGEERSVGEILDYMKIEATLLTHHLAKMRNLGILESNREGRNIYYKLALPELTSMFDCVQNCRI